MPAESYDTPTIRLLRLAEQGEPTHVDQAQGRFVVSLREAINSACTCGGNSSGPAACPACEVWHRMLGVWE